MRIVLSASVLAVDIMVENQDCLIWSLLYTVDIQGTKVG